MVSSSQFLSLLILEGWPCCGLVHPLILREMGRAEELPELSGLEGPGGLVIRVPGVGEEAEDGKGRGVDWEELRRMNKVAD